MPVVQVFSQPHHAGDVLRPEHGVEAPGQAVGIDVRADRAFALAVLDDRLEPLVGGLVRVRHCVTDTDLRPRGDELEPRVRHQPALGPHLLEWAAPIFRNRARASAPSVPSISSVHLGEDVFKGGEQRLLAAGEIDIEGTFETFGGFGDTGYGCLGDPVPGHDVQYGMDDLPARFCGGEPAYPCLACQLSSPPLPVDIRRPPPV